MNKLAENLKANKLKVTPQRLAIYSYLTSTNEHPTAETIYNRLKEDYPAMSLATVYKTVASLRDCHLIREFNLGEDCNRYDANSDIHSHLLCTKCHRVFDYYGDIDLKHIMYELKAGFGFETTALDMNFYGICEDCRKNDNKD